MIKILAVVLVLLVVGFVRHSYAQEISESLLIEDTLDDESSYGDGLEDPDFPEYDVA